jgi:peroxiredoxin
LPLVQKRWCGRYVTAEDLSTSVKIVRSALRVAITGPWRGERPAVFVVGGDGKVKHEYVPEIASEPNYAAALSAARAAG